jgi:hypothetical protein
MTYSSYIIRGIGTRLSSVNSVSKIEQNWGFHLWFH